MLLYRLVTLPETEPPIWRCLQVPGTVTLHTLHRMRQVVMGWEKYHLRGFIVADHHYSEPSPKWLDDDMEMRDSTRGKLQDLVTEQGAAFSYVYDSGDDWQHALVVGEIIATRATVRQVVCLDVALAGPPEDGGGVYDSAEMLEIIQHPEHEEYESWITWLESGETGKPSTWTKRTAG